MKDKAKTIVEALGGRENVVSVDACITRLRIQLIDSDVINQTKIKKQGAHWIQVLGGGAIQIIWGTQANLMESALKDVINGK